MTKVLLKHIRTKLNSISTSLWRLKQEVGDTQQEVEVALEISQMNDAVSFRRSLETFQTLEEAYIRHVALQDEYLATVAIAHFLAAMGSQS